MYNGNDFITYERLPIPKARKQGKTGTGRNDSPQKKEPPPPTPLDYRIRNIHGTNIAMAMVFHSFRLASWS